MACQHIKRAARCTCSSVSHRHVMSCSPVPQRVVERQSVLVQFTSRLSVCKPGAPRCLLRRAILLARHATSCDVCTLDDVAAAAAFVRNVRCRNLHTLTAPPLNALADNVVYRDVHTPRDGRCAHCAHGAHGAHDTRDVRALRFRLSGACWPRGVCTLKALHWGVPSPAYVRII